MNKLDNNKIKLSEKELIELTIDRGFQGNEFNNKYYIENGHLRAGSDTYKGFIKKVKSFCDSVIRIRKKRNREDQNVYYIVEGLKEESVGYVDNRGKNKSELDYLLAYLIFNRMLLKKDVLPEHSWILNYCDILDLPIVKDNGVAAHKLYNFIQKNFSSKLILSLFENYHKRINRRATETLKSCLNTLENEGKVKVTTVYIGKDENGREVYFNKEGYNIVKKWLGDMFKKSSFSYGKWYFSANGRNKTKRDEIERLLLNKHGVTNIYKKYRIEILSHEPYNLPERDLKDVYFEKLDILSHRHQLKQYKKIEKLQKIYMFDFIHEAIMKAFNLVYFYNYSYYDLLDEYPDVVREIKTASSETMTHYHNRKLVKQYIRKALSSDSFGYEKYLDVDNYLDLMLEVLKEMEEEKFFNDTNFDIDDYYEMVSNLSQYANDLENNPSP